MNKEEAIANLNMISVAFVDPVTKEQRKLIDDTFEMAIQALSQEPCERFEWGIDGNVYKITKAKDGKEICQQVCDDAISRDMALEKMADYVASGYADSAEDFEEYSRIICQLPSVTQKPTECDDTVSRGVFEQVMRERDIAIEQLHELGYELGQKIEPLEVEAAKLQKAYNKGFEACRQAVLDEIDDTNRRGGFGCKLSYTRCRGHIEQLPSATQKSGKWLYKRITDDYRVTGQCSECKERRIIDNFCPNCGAKMKSEDGVCKDCYYNDGEVHAECVICDKAESEVEQ